LISNEQDGVQAVHTGNSAEANAQTAADDAVRYEETAEASTEEAADHADPQASTELDNLRRQAEENYQRFLRVQADFDNFRRRARQEKEEFAKYASLKLIEQLLPIVDNFERALQSSRETSDFEALAKGLDMTSRQLAQVLEQEGLRPMESVGQPFNPEYHQAIMQVESEEHEEGIVVEEVQKGYMLKDKVLRPAMVKVSM
jgi:molecular chaperone GrpE